MLQNNIQACSSLSVDNQPLVPYKRGDAAGQAMLSLRRFPHLDRQWPHNVSVRSLLWKLCVGKARVRLQTFHCVQKGLERGDR
ncbi:hypothetical protein BDV37DRAFT_243965 [Aspergillus pseudonomiae]|uniref:Uncharacterized protein n=1 Tax=Aspergillus pseudonomiae TaxID=1506151 RepID=A0A5N7DKS5_9EURO|nr:uncharacterized protein BDV37DRAFT_243965 [Aspergillus pseudonomiae]KAE8406078.1 hypothetical protein BDV37DRAFT_243965 [Aspergillus pseudonomiae]